MFRMLKSWLELIKVVSGSLTGLNGAFFLHQGTHESSSRRLMHSIPVLNYWLSKLILQGIRLLLSFECWAIGVCVVEVA